MSDKQLAKYHAMLPPICEKLGIDVPELYVTLDVYPNAYTYGDTSPFIVLTSGLFETLPEELIPSVIAHECGHIACHHTLYTTMGRLLKDTAYIFATGLGNIAMYPIQLAFAYWMRCSELSADRAAALCDGNSDKVIETNMRFAGLDKDITDDASVDLFLEQAVEYREFAKESAWNKTLEFLQFQMYDHPQSAVRALEAREWAETDRFRLLREYMTSTADDRETLLPIYVASKDYVGKDVQFAIDVLSKKGVQNVASERVTESKTRVKDGTVIGFEVEGKENFVADWIPRDTKITLKYYEHKTDEEIAQEHVGEIRISGNKTYFTGRPYTNVEMELKDAGFRDIETKEMAIPIFGNLFKEGNVAKILIDGKEFFNKGDWFDPNVKIVIYYYVKI
ncbi:MAG: M48 family metallopeptidase [Lachnospiraceae bacterium]|nr:M48 family metallopeptidase [Lachnospiraceae bacterium]